MTKFHIALARVSYASFGPAPPLPKISRWDGGSGKREGGEGWFVRPTCSGVRTTCNRAEAHAGLRGWGSHEPLAGAPPVAMI